MLCTPIFLLKVTITFSRILNWSESQQGLRTPNVYSLFQFINYVLSELLFFWRQWQHVDIINLTLHHLIGSAS